MPAWLRQCRIRPSLRCPVPLCCCRRHHHCCCHIGARRNALLGNLVAEGCLSETGDEASRKTMLVGRSPAAVAAGGGSGGGCWTLRTLDATGCAASSFCGPSAGSRPSTSSSEELALWCAASGCWCATSGASLNERVALGRAAKQQARRPRPTIAANSTRSSTASDALPMPADGFNGNAVFFAAAICSDVSHKRWRRMTPLHAAPACRRTLAFRCRLSLQN